MAKSEWNPVWLGDDKSKTAVLSWFRPFCDDMIPEKAELLVDIDTDREKKIRAVMIDKDGKRRIAMRTLGAKTYTISLKRARTSP